MRNSSNRTVAGWSDHLKRNATWRLGSGEGYGIIVLGAGSRKRRRKRVMRCFLILRGKKLDKGFGSARNVQEGVYGYQKNKRKGF